MNMTVKINEKPYINPSNEFHILRHFTHVSEEYKIHLIGKEYWYYDYSEEKYMLWIITKEDIGNALATIGTKFQRDIPWIDSPKEILDIIYKRIVSFIPEEEQFSYTFEYTVPIWYINCIDRKNLSEEEKMTIKRVRRGNCKWENWIQVNTLSGKQQVMTNSIYVSIIQVENVPFPLVTAFPYCNLDDSIPDEDLVFLV